MKPTREQLRPHLYGDLRRTYRNTLLPPPPTPLLLRDKQTEIPVASTSDHGLSWLKITPQGPIRATTLPFLLSHSPALSITPHCPSANGQAPLHSLSPWDAHRYSHFHLLQQQHSNMIVITMMRKNLYHLKPQFSRL